MPTKAPAKSKPKSTGKTSDIPVGALIPQPHGGAIRNGGTNAGGTGRPPSAFKDFLAELRSNPTALAALKKAASDPEMKSFGAAWKIVTDYDTDKPAEKKELSGKVEVTVRVAREGRRVTAG